MADSLSDRINELILRIPPGTVASYGQIADMAGNPRAARQVVRVLHSRSHSHRLPWHRVINSKGQISLPEGGGREEQSALLAAEGVEVDVRGRISLSRHGWNGA